MSFAVNVPSCGGGAPRPPPNPRPPPPGLQTMRCMPAEVENGSGAGRHKGDVFGMPPPAAAPPRPPRTPPRPAPQLESLAGALVKIATHAPRASRISIETGPVAADFR